jgi:hypothetical protein
MYEMPTYVLILIQANAIVSIHKESFMLFHIFHSSCLIFYWNSWNLFLHIHLSLYIFKLDFKIECYIFIFASILSPKIGYINNHIGCVAQVEELLHYKYKSLSSNPSCIKKNYTDYIAKSFWVSKYNLPNNLTS